MIEEATRFSTPPMAGVICRPDLPTTSDLPGVVLLSPGLLHRVGPNRIYVKLARSLAEAGYNVLRFDFSGQGESPPRTDNLPLQVRAIAETGAAIDHLIERVGCRNVVLIGHCSGAVFGLMSAFTDERIAGVVSISPEGGDEDWVEFDRRKKEARYYANYYGKGALADAGRWKRLLTGRADYASIARNVFRNIVWYRVTVQAYRLRSVRGASVKSADERPEVREFKDGLRSLAERQLPIILIHPDQSAGRELLRALLGDTIEEARRTGNVQIAVIPASDHMFTPLAAQRELILTIQEWLGQTGALDSPASLVSVSR